MDSQHRRYYYSPKDLLQVFDSPRNNNEKLCWELDTTTLLQKFHENIRQAVTVDFATASLVLQGAAKTYSFRVSSLEKDVHEYILKLASYSRIEGDQYESESAESEESDVTVEIVEAEPNRQGTQIEQPTLAPITDEIAIPENPQPARKAPKPIDINKYLEQLFRELQTTLHNFDPESANNSIFNVVDRQLRRKSCDIFLKHLNESIPLMEVIRLFLNDNEPGLVTKPNEYKRFLATKMILLVDVRNEVFIPNLSIQDDMLQIRILLKEYLLDEIVRLSSCHDDCLSAEKNDTLNQYPEGNELENNSQETEINRTLDSGIHDSNVSCTEETAPDTMEDSEPVAAETPEISGITDCEIASCTQETPIIGTQDSGINCDDISTLDQNSVVNQQETVDVSLTNQNVIENQQNSMILGDDADFEDEMQHSEEDTESLLIDCEAVRECQEATQKITVNKVQVHNMFGLPKRLLRKKMYFRLSDDILEWARIHRNIYFTQAKKISRKGVKSKAKKQKILKRFITKNQRSSKYKMHFKKLQSECFIPLNSIPCNNEKISSSEVSDKNQDAIISPSPPPLDDDTQNLNSMKEQQQPIQIVDENDGTTTASLNEIFANDLLSAETSCFDDESGVDRHDEDDIETDSYKTLTHDSNVESGIFTDMTTGSSTRDNTPSCNTTRKNSFLSEYHDDITNMTIATTTTQSNCRTLFNRYDSTTIEQLEEVPEGNILNQIAERMQDYQEQERELLEMYERVDKWHQSIRDRLLHAKRRENWDVIKYEDQILMKVPETPGKIHFSLIVARKSYEEICRVFLATLILASEGNIIISKTNTDSLDVNNFTLSKALKIVRNHEVMNDRLEKICRSKKQKKKALKPTPGSSTESLHQVSEQLCSNETPFVQRLYGSEKSDTEDEIETIKNSDEKAFMASIDNLLDYYATDQENFEPEARLNIDYDRPAPQNIRRRGRKTKVQLKKPDKNIYVFDNKQYDSSDLDEYVTRIVCCVNAFEQREKAQQMISVSNDLPLVLSAPFSNRTTKCDSVASPKTKLSISKRNELNGSRRRVYISSSDDDDDYVPPSGLHTPRRAPHSKSMTRNAPEKNTTDSYLKRYKIFDSDEESEKSSKRRKVSDDYAIPGPSGLQKTTFQRMTCDVFSDNDSSSSFDYELTKAFRKRSITSVNVSSTPLNKQPRYFPSPGGSGLSRITLFDSDT